MRALDLTARGIAGTVVVLVVVAGCVRLGLWQLDRRAERAARNEVIAERMALPPVALTDAPRDTGGLAYRRARFAGRADGDRALILAGRSRNGAPGVNVLSPIRLRTGAVLVNRGWLPAPDAATVDLDPTRLHGPVEAEGVLLPFPDVDRESEPGPFRVTWFRFDGDAIRAQYPYPVAPLYLATTAVVEPAAGEGGRGPDRASTDPEAAAAGPDGAPAGTAPAAPIPPGAPELDPGPHLSYAVQWFGFAAIALIGWLVLLVQRARQPSDEQPASPPGG